VRARGWGIDREGLFGAARVAAGEEEFGAHRLQRELRELPGGTPRPRSARPRARPAGTGDRQWGRRYCLGAQAGLGGVRWRVRGRAGAWMPRGSVRRASSSSAPRAYSVSSARASVSAGGGEGKSKCRMSSIPSACCAADHGKQQVVNDLSINSGE